MALNPDQLLARLQKSPQDLGSLTALREQLTRLGDVNSHIQLLEWWASLAVPVAGNPAPQVTASQAAQALMEAAHLCFTAVGDLQKAIELAERSLFFAPQSQDASEYAESLLRQGGDAERLRTFLEARLAWYEQHDPHHRFAAVLNYRVAEVWRDVLGRDDRAVLHFRQAYDIDNTLLIALYEARQIYARAGNLKVAAQLLEIESQQEQDAHRKASLLFELANQKNALGDRDGAIASFDALLQRVPGDFSTAQNLADLLAARAAERGFEGPAEADRIRAAQLYEQLAAQTEGESSFGWLSRALTMRPESETALAALEALAVALAQQDSLPFYWVAYLARAKHSDFARERRLRLAEAYTQHGQYDFAVACLDTLVADGDAEAASRVLELSRAHSHPIDRSRYLAVAARAGDTKSRVIALTELATSFRDRNDLEAAFGYAEELLALDPNSELAFSLMKSTHEKRENFSALYDLLIRSGKNENLAIDLRKQHLREAASRAEHSLSDASRVEAAVRILRSVDPRDEETRQAWLRILEENRSWNELSQALGEALLATTDREARIAILRRLVHLHLHDREDLAEATATLLELKSLVPGDDRVRNELLDTYLRTRNEVAAIPLLRERVEKAVGLEKLADLETLARFLEENAHDLEGAYSAWNEIYSLSPSHAQALARLIQISREQRDFARLLARLEMRLDRETSSEKVQTLLEMAQVAEEELKDTRKASGFLTSATKLDPEHPQLFEHSLSLLIKSNDLEGARKVLDERLERAKTPADQIELLVRKGRFESEQSKDVGRAKEAFAAALSLGPSNEALSFLRKSALEEKDDVSLANINAQLAAIANDTSEQAQLLAERADALVRIGNSDDALLEWKSICENYAPSDLVYAKRWSDLAQVAGGPKDVADAFAHRVRITEDEGLRAPLAKVWAESLLENEGASSRELEEALKLWARCDPSERKPRALMIDRFSSDGRWTEALAWLDELAQLEHDDREIGARTLQAAIVSAEKLNDVQSAWDRLVPRVMLGDSSAEEYLEEMAERFDRQKALATLHLSRVPSAADSSERKQLSKRAAEAFDRAGDLVSAMDALAPAIREELSSGVDASATLEAFDELVVRHSAVEVSPDAWLRHYESWIGLVGPERLRLALLDRVVQLLAKLTPEHPALFQLAWSAYEIALREGTASTDRLDQLGTLAVADGAKQDFAVKLGAKLQQAAQAGRRDEAFHLATRLGRFTAVHLQNPSAAGDAFAAAVAMSSQQPEELIALESEVEGLESSKGWNTHPLLQAIATAYETAAARDQVEPTHGAKLLDRAALLTENQLADPSTAYRLVHDACTLDPQSGERLDHLVRLGIRLRKVRELEEFLGSSADQALDRNTAIQLLLRQAHILDRELKSPTKSIPVWKRLRSLAPSDLSIREGYRDALKRAAKHSDLIAELEDERKNADAKTEVALLREIASIWEQGLRNRWEATESWQRLLRLEPTNAEALAAVERLKSAPALITEEALAEEVLSADLSQELSATPEQAREDSSEHADKSPIVAPETFDTTEVVAEDELAAEDGTVDEPIDDHEAEMFEDSDTTIAVLDLGPTRTEDSGELAGVELLEGDEDPALDSSVHAIAPTRSQEMLRPRTLSETASREQSREDVAREEILQSTEMVFADLLETRNGSEEEVEPEELASAELSVSDFVISPLEAPAAGSTTGPTEGTLVVQLEDFQQITDDEFEVASGELFEEEDLPDWAQSELDVAKVAGLDEYPVETSDLTALDQEFAEAILQADDANGFEDDDSSRPVLASIPPPLPSSGPSDKPR